MSTDLNEISACEVCGSGQLTPALDLGSHPMCDDLVRIGDERICREYPIEILLCEICLTAHQRFQIPKHELFPASYHYRSRFTADVLDGMAGLVASCEQQFGSLAGKIVADVGCNDGSLLDMFARRGAVTVGVEPTGACVDAQQKGHSVFCDYLSEQVAAAIVARHGRPDFITFTNVFAHIEDLRGVLRSLATLMSTRSVIVIENHYLGAVLRGGQFDTFYHEHPRSYSYTSFVHIARALGREILHVEFPSRYGGNIRVFLGTRTGAALPRPAADLSISERRFPQQFALLRGNIASWRERKARLLQALVQQHGRLRAKAFPGRAAILLKMLSLTEASLAAVYEKPGSLKVGHYVPGTRIPIHSDHELFASTDEAQPVLNLAWHIAGEIRSYLRSHGYRGEVIDILSADDFPIS